MEKIDATTREGFLEIASAFGRERAHETRIAQLRDNYEKSLGFRWFYVRHERALSKAIFERNWERANPEAAQMLREGYPNIFY